MRTETSNGVAAIATEYSLASIPEGTAEHRRLFSTGENESKPNGTRVEP